MINDFFASCEEGEDMPMSKVEKTLKHPAGATCRVFFR